MKALNLEFKPVVRPPVNRPQDSPKAPEQRYRYMRVLQQGTRGGSRAFTMMPLLLDRPFGCPMCGCTYATQAALKKHVKRHSPCPNSPCSGSCCCRTHPVGETGGVSGDAASSQAKPFLPHICTQCGKSFRTAGYLAVHRRMHSGVRPFSCACGKAFVRRCNLRAHLVSHTRERPHACLRPDCGQRFQFRKQLERHVCQSQGQQEDPSPLASPYVPQKSLTSASVPASVPGTMDPTEDPVEIVAHIRTPIRGATGKSQPATHAVLGPWPRPWPSPPDEKGVVAGVAGPLPGRLPPLGPVLLHRTRQTVPPGISGTSTASSPATASPASTQTPRVLTYVGLRKALLLHVTPAAASQASRPRTGQRAVLMTATHPPPRTGVLAAVVERVQRVELSEGGTGSARCDEAVQLDALLQVGEGAKCHGTKLDDPEFIDIEVFAALHPEFGPC